jgi:SAM-dependent methyltransferase
MLPLSDIAHKRLYPPLTDPNFLVLRSRRLIFTSWARALGDAPLRVLDVGGKYQPYRPLLSAQIGSYIAVDLKITNLVTVVASGEALPFQRESFDLAIATQVFDYFGDPHEAARQIHAVLRPSGVLLASVPGCAPRFADDEKWRFTPSGLRSVLSPFARVEILPEVSNLGSMLRMTNLAVNAFLPWKSIRSAYNSTICPALNLLGLGLESLSPTTSDQFAANYSIRATKED